MTVHRLFIGDSRERLNCSAAGPVTQTPSRSAGIAPQPLRIRLVLRPARHGDPPTVEALQAGAQHRAVDLAQESAGDVDDAVA